MDGTGTATRICARLFISPYVHEPICQSGVVSSQILAVIPNVKRFAFSNMTNLFESVKAISDQKYLLVRDDPRFHEQRLFLENLWRVFSPFADPNFKSELAIQFHPRFWEMYLTCTLIEMGFDLVPRKSSYGPDIHINLNGKNLWIEATAPDAGIGDDAVPGYSGLDDSIQFIRVPEEQMILRLTNSFYKKCWMYEEYVSSGLISKNDIFVVAINGFNVPHILGEDEIPYIVKSVLPFGDLTVTINIDEMKPVDEFYEYRGHIQKKSGANVPTKAFQDPTYSFVSGVLYSTAELWNLPASFGSDFKFVHNPIAYQILDKEWISRGMSIWVEGDQLRFKRIAKSA